MLKTRVIRLAAASIALGTLGLVVAAPASAQTSIGVQLSVPGITVVAGNTPYAYGVPTAYYPAYDVGYNRGYRSVAPRGWDNQHRDQRWEGRDNRRDHRQTGWNHRGDQDRDGIANRFDRDRDGDGVPNRFDHNPNNPRRR